MGDSQDLFLSSNQECLEFFNIPEARSAHYFLMDKRWNLIHYSKVETKALNALFNWLRV